MPRSLWVPENRYCRRSKIPEDLFYVLIDAYFSELINCKSRNYIADLISVGLSNNRKSLSVQSIGKYFDLFGNYIWNNIIEPMFAERNEPVTKENMYLFFYERIKDSDIDFYFPAHLSDDFGAVKTMPFRRSFMYLLLNRRSKLVNGFKEQRFYLEYSRAAFVETMLVTMNLQYYPNELFMSYLLDPDESYAYHKLSRNVNAACYVCLKNMFEKNPLG